MQIQRIGLITLLFISGAAVAQSPSGTATAESTLTAAAAGIQDDVEVSRDKREQAYAKVLEGQRFVWKAGRIRSPGARTSTIALAKAAFRKSVELDPTLAEGYTALAELAANGEQPDLDEAISLATIAAKIEPNNFGARRILARLYTYKSGIQTDSPDLGIGGKAIEEWKQVARLDPRNAEAWAILSFFYDKTSQDGERIEALKKWISSAAPVDSTFYRRLVGAREELSPEAATLKLGEALFKANRVREAVVVLTNLIADEPDSADAIVLLQEALSQTSGEEKSSAIASLAEAVRANAANTALVSMLGAVYADSGRTAEAEKLLGDTSKTLVSSDAPAAAQLQLRLGDLYARSDRFDAAAEAYKTSFEMRTLDSPAALNEEEREFAMLVFGKWIQALKARNPQGDVRAVIDRARKLLGPRDLFPDREIISFYRESGRRTEALAAIRAVRKRAPDDYGFIRLEATVLTELGRVDEGAEIIRSLMVKKAVAVASEDPRDSSVSVSVPAYDDFSNYLFISNLYTQAGRHKEAGAAADAAYATARGSERKQIAKLTLATAQQMAGDFQGAEATLREILKVSPGNPIAMNNLGYFLIERGLNFEEATELIRKAVDIDPTNPSYLDSLGWAYFKLGRFEEAEKYLKEAARTDPTSSTILEHLGDLYIKLNNAELAKVNFERSLNLATDPEDQKRLKEKLKRSR
jgi:tetratricopeptide (TPR) repeat protein